MLYSLSLCISVILHNIVTIVIAQLAGAVEYTDCTSAEG